jgi:cytochrome c peroxidase
MEKGELNRMTRKTDRCWLLLVLGLVTVCLLPANREGFLPPASVRAQAAWPEMPGYAAMEIPADNPLTPAKVELGKQLFYDRRLSGDGKRSCFFCHLPPRGLSNGRGEGIGAYDVVIPRSPPTLWNVGYYSALFWDGRAASLEAAVKDIWSGPFLGATGQAGHPSMSDICRQLDAVQGYRKEFQEIFGQGCSPDNVAKAVASFLRTIVANNSAWARFRAGDEAALSPAARRGWDVFRTKGRCTNCHDGVLLTDQQFHNIGIGMENDAPDLGRYAVTHNEADRGAFKTPTLLNVSQTSPYFHDGSAKTLEEAVDLMLAGGRDNPYLDQANLRPPVTLTKDERKDLLAFLQELTVQYLVSSPKLPR